MRCKITCIAYANLDWKEGDGGELLLLDQRGSGLKRCWRSVKPVAGRVVLFRCEKMLHKVSPCFRKRFAKFDAMFGDTDLAEKMHKLMVNSVLTNDWEGIKLHNWETQPAVSEIRKRKQGVKTWRD